MVVIVVTGMPGAGKEEFVQVALSRGFQIVRMGDVVREWAAKYGTANDDRGVGGFANDERQKFGYDVWAKRCVDRISSERAIIDGSRGIMEMDVYRHTFGDSAMLVAIHSAPRTRYPRLVARKRADAPKSWEEFAARDARELSWGLGSLIAVSDTMIVNEGALDEFREECAHTIDRLSSICPKAY